MLLITLSVSVSFRYFCLLISIHLFYRVYHARVAVTLQKCYGDAWEKRVVRLGAKPLSGVEGQRPVCGRELKHLSWTSFSINYWVC